MTQYTKKINKSGKYLPFYGYTVIGMWKDREVAGKEISHFIENSLLRKYFAPLNHSTYHMTIFNIYALAGNVIPPVKKWLENKKNALPKKNWLPEIVLSSHNAKAEFVLCNHNLNNIKTDSINMYNVTSLGVDITIDETDIQIVRKKLGKIYKHSDENLKRLHMTFAYKIPGSPPLDDDAKKDLEILLNMVKNIKNVEFDNFGVYLFDSMENYIKDGFFYSSTPQF